MKFKYLSSKYFKKIIALFIDCKSVKRYRLLDVPQRIQEKTIVIQNMRHSLTIQLVLFAYNVH